MIGGGGGGGGTVITMQYLYTGLFTLSDVRSLVNEIIKMKDFCHPHVMPLIGVCLDAGPGVSMVMPYMTNGSLLDYLKKERNNLDLNSNDLNKVINTVKQLPAY